MIVVNYGTDIVKTTLETLEASDIRSYLKPGASVSIKPNLVVSRPAKDVCAHFRAVACECAGAARHGGGVADHGGRAAGAAGTGR